jgi:two-component system NtrC family sensor kinase
MTAGATYVVEPSTLPRGAARKPWLLVLGMLGAIALVTALAWWDEEREGEAALNDLGTEQGALASSLAAGLKAYLADGERDPSHLAGALLTGAPPIEHHGELKLLLAPPFETALRTSDGRELSSPRLRDALDRGVSVVRLTRSEAAECGLLARTAMAGLAHLDAAPFGRWGVVAVATAARQRDRESRARWRLVLGVMVASGLVLAFGGIALRNQRKELHVEQQLVLAEVQRERDQKLLQAQRIATTGTFAMGIVHEVATPLGVIVGRAEQLLGRLKDDDRSAKSAEIIVQQAELIQHTVRRFLDLARGGPPAFDRVDPAEVVRSAANSVQHRFAEAEVALKADVQMHMPQVHGDRALLEHAIVNLLLNACEACATGGQVEVLAREDAERVAFVVTDDGVGISPEHASQATEPFFTTKPAGRGTGLGLAIASEIAKAHRGELAISARGLRGTRACIEIPSASREGSRPYVA